MNLVLKDKAGVLLVHCPSDGAEAAGIDAGDMQHAAKQQLNAEKKEPALKPQTAQVCTHSESTHNPRVRQQLICWS